MRVVAIVLALGFASCSTGAPLTATMPDGRVAKMAYCDGNDSSMATCYNEAAKKCGGKYEVVDRSESSPSSSMPRREIAYICETAASDPRP